MKYLVLIFLSLSFFSQILFADSNISHPVFGGTMVEPEDIIAKSSVALVDHTDGVFCSGVVIDKDLVLTAAHCLNKGKPVLRFTVNANFEYVPTRQVVQMQKHEDYDSNTKKANHDIALLYFEGGLPKNVVPAKLPTKNYAISIGDTFTVAGYGASLPQNSNYGIGFLRKASLNVLDVHPAEQVLTLDQSGKSGVCYGDSGSPLYKEIEGQPLLVLGIADMVEKPNCRNYSVYAVTSYYLDWIQQTAKKLRDLRWQDNHGIAGNL